MIKFANSVAPATVYYHDYKVCELCSLTVHIQISLAVLHDTIVQVLQKGKSHEATCAISAVTNEGIHSMNVYDL